MHFDLCTNDHAFVNRMENVKIAVVILAAVDSIRANAILGGFIECVHDSLASFFFRRQHVAVCEDCHAFHFLVTQKVISKCAVVVLVAPDHVKYERAFHLDILFNLLTGANAWAHRHCCKKKQSDHCVDDLCVRIVFGVEAW